MFSGSRPYLSHDERLIGLCMNDEKLDSDAVSDADLRETLNGRGATLIESKLLDQPARIAPLAKGHCRE